MCGCADEMSAAELAVGRRNGAYSTLDRTWVEPGQIWIALLDESVEDRYHLGTEPTRTKKKERM